MTVPLVYEISSIGEDKLKRTMRSIESEAKASASRMDTVSRRSVRGGRAPADPQAWQAARGFDQIGRAARAADAAAIRERMAGDKRASAERLRQIATEERAATRAAKAAANVQERTSRRFASGVASTVGGSVKKVVGLGANALALGGGLLGGVAAGSAIESTIALQHAQRAVIRNARGAGQADAYTSDELGKRVSSAALSTGASQEDVTAGLAAFVAKTGDLKTAVGNLQSFSTVAMATGASVEDIAGAAADLAQKFDISTTEGMAEALSVLAFQGKKGAFELKNMAAEFPVLASAAARSGMTGEKGVKQLGGLIQIATVGAGKGEATTSLVDAFSELTKHAAELEGAGVHIFKKGKGIGHGEVQNDFQDSIREVISAKRGDLTKLDPIFGLRGIKAVSPMISAYNKASIGAGGGAKGDAAGRAAIDAMIKTNIEAGGTFAEIQKDAANALKDTSSQLENARTLFTNAVGQQMLPVLTSLIPKFTELIPTIANATGVFAGFAEKLIDDPIPNIGKLIAAKVGFDLAEAGIGAVLKSGLETALKAATGGAIGAGGVLSVFVTGGLIGVTLGAAAGNEAAGRLADPGTAAAQSMLDLAQGKLSDPKEISDRRAMLQSKMTDLQENGPGAVATVFGGVSKALGGQSASEVQQASVASLQTAIDKLSAALSKGGDDLVGKLAAANVGGGDARRTMPIGAR
jgi:hypothetical protein